jgi:hypothetical protein
VPAEDVLDDPVAVLEAHVVVGARPVEDRGVEPVLFLDSPDPYDSAPACAASPPVIGACS